MRPELDEGQVEGAVNQVNNLIQNLDGNVQRTDVWGKRRLAYEVNRLREGYYVLTEFQIEQPRIPEMEATLRISDTVFRHVIVRRPPPRTPGQKGQRRAAASAPEPAAASATEPAAQVAANGHEPAASEPATQDDVQPTAAASEAGVGPVDIEAVAPATEQPASTAEEEVE